MKNKKKLKKSIFFILGAIVFFIIAGFLAKEEVKLIIFEFFGFSFDNPKFLANSRNLDEALEEVKSRYSKISLGYKIVQASMVIIGIFLLGMGVYYLITYFNEKSEEDKNSINQ